jgi:hypothetical protein
MVCSFDKTLLILYHKFVPKIFSGSRVEVK